MGLLPVPRHVTFENRGRNRNVTHRVEAVPIDRQHERHWVCDTALTESVGLPKTHALVGNWAKLANFF
jgi:hypothetical protein